TSLTNQCCVAIDDLGTLHVLWGGYYYPSNYRQYYRNYHPTTATASPIVDVTAMTGSVVTSRTAAMDVAVDALNQVWLVTQSNQLWREKLYFSAPYAVGGTFTDAGFISPSASAQSTRIAIDATGVVHCSYYRNVGAGEYEHRAYTPGVGWGASTRLGNTTAPNDFYGVLCADLLGNVHSVYVKDAASPSTWQFAYRMRDSSGVWGAEVPVFSATTAQYTGVANYFIFSVACEETTGFVNVLYRDLAAGGQLRVAQKPLSQPAFVSFPLDLTAPSTALHEYYLPTIRGSLYPASNYTGRDLDFTWNLRPAGSTQFSLVFQRIESITIAPLGPATLGTTQTIFIHSADDALTPYVCGFAFAPAPGIGLADGRVIPLALDFLLTLSLDPLNGIFVNTIGALDGLADGAVAFNVPNLPVLTGATIYCAFVTADFAHPTGIGTISPPIAITMQ
ncbi:MAG TPA: hypothetical protein VEI02_09295, partial [Planctomycetota bacterium]|nr:hypothetical protein [Planctomycetota bacterium]